jgi:hypothetical protein
LTSSSIIPGTISGNQTFCGSGNPSTIGSSNNGNDGLSNVSSTLSYRWEESTNNINWVTITGENSNTYSPPNLSVTTYYRRSLRVKVGNNFACLSAPSNVVTVTVNNNFSVTAGPDIVICKGQSINLTAIGSGTTDIITYQWSGPNGFSSNNQNPTISNATIVRSGNYTVTARISSDCSVTDVVNVLVIDEPSIFNEELVVCITQPGQNTGYASFQLNIPSNTSHILNYTINWGDGSTIEQYNTNWNNTISHEYGIGISNFIITLNSTNGCSISKQFSVFVGSSPSSATLVLNQNQANGCAPLTTTWTLTIPNNITGTSYTCNWGEIGNLDNFVYNQGGSIPANTATMSWSAPSINPTTLVTTYTITKTFLNSSCGNNVVLGTTTYYNAYQPVVTTRNPCTTTPQPSGTGLVTIGQKPTASYSKGRNAKYGYYHGRHQCKTRVRKEKAEDTVVQLLSGLKINSNINSLFVEILKDSANELNGNKTKELLLKKTRYDEIQTQLTNADELFLSGKMPSDRYNITVERYNAELMQLELELEVLEQVDGDISENIETGIMLLENLDQMFYESDNEGKKMILGSLFTEKLIFGNEMCRTTEVNEVIRILTRNGRGLESTDKKKAVKNDSFSVIVPGVGIEPTHLSTRV